MLPRLLASATPIPSRRAYSFFSSKPGGGRSFNPNNKSAKVPAVAAKATPAQPSSPKPPTTSISPAPAASETSTSQSSVTKSADSGAHSSSSTLPKAPGESDVAPPRLVSPPPLAGSHPHLNLPTLHLHNFFALDRPLLLLSQPPSSLFESLQGKHLSPSPSHLTELASGEDAFGTIMEDEEADVDAARLLAKSLVTQRVSSTMDWSDVMVKLGLPDDIRVQMDSVKRKRKKKMTKHRSGKTILWLTRACH